MLKTFLIGATGMAMFLVAGMCSANKATLPEYKATDTFVFSNRRVESVIRVEDELLVMKSRSGREYTRHRNFIVPPLSWQVGGREANVKVVGKPEALWPLDVGKRSRFRTVKTQTDNTTGRSIRSVDLWSCRVKGKETLTVSAGTYDSYRVECDRFSESSMRLQKRYVWYYAPIVGHYVKREVINYKTGNNRSYELIAALEGRNANRKRIESILK